MSDEGGGSGETDSGKMTKYSRSPPKSPLAHLCSKVNCPVYVRGQEEEGEAGEETKATCGAGLPTGSFGVSRVGQLRQQQWRSGMTKEVNCLTSGCG